MSADPRVNLLHWAAFCLCLAILYIALVLLSLVPVPPIVASVG